MKPLLVGESNPYGGDDYYALYPSPDGCSGHRLCCLILGMAVEDYLEVFDRINLVQGPWNMKDARRRAQELWERPEGKFILFGVKVCVAWQTPFVPFKISDGGTCLVLPHPSGLNRWWSYPDVIPKARAAVAAFAPEVAHLLGTTEILS